MSRGDSPNMIARYTTIITQFWISDASAALTDVFTWSASVISRATVWPALVRWKKPSGRVCRCRNRRTRRSRTTPSWITTDQ